MLAWLDWRLYGSPFVSGYGRASAIFTGAHFLGNVRRYTGWLVESQTPIVLAGAAAIAVPLSWLWPGTRDRRIFVVVASFVALVWLSYCLYLEFDAWWYLRFLLSTWPFIMLGVGAIVMALARRIHQHPAASFALLVSVIAVGARGVVVAQHGHAFRLWEEERRYVAVARLVRQSTEPRSVIFSMQHSGSLRYYGDRMTIRYDLIDPAWADRSVMWFVDHGIHPYLLAEDWELPMIQARFPGTATLARTTGAPILIFCGYHVVELFDLASFRDPVTADVRVVEDPVRGARDVSPGPVPQLQIGGSPVAGGGASRPSS